MDTRQIIDSYYDSVNKGDWNTWLGLFQENVVIDEQLAGHVEGLDILRGAVGGLVGARIVFGLRGVTLSIAKGEFAFFVGHTGAGKSTVLKLLTRELYPHLKKRKGVIVNVIGMAGEHGTFEYICGATANAGLANFTKALGRGYAQHGVRVVGVHPPSTRTDRIITLMKAQAKAKFGDESRYEELMGNVIEPEQVGDTVCFLASARAGHLSGVVLNLGS